MIGISWKKLSVASYLKHTHSRLRSNITKVWLLLSFGAKYPNLLIWCTHWKWSSYIGDHNSTRFRHVSNGDGTKWWGLFICIACIVQVTHLYPTCTVCDCLLPLVGLKEVTSGCKDILSGHQPHDHFGCKRFSARALKTFLWSEMVCWVSIWSHGSRQWLWVLWYKVVTKWSQGGASCTVTGALVIKSTTFM